MFKYIVKNDVVSKEDPVAMQSRTAGKMKRVSQKRWIGEISTAHLVAGDHMVPRFDSGDPLPHTLHNSRSLVAQDAGKQTLRICPPHLVVSRSTNWNRQKFPMLKGS
jgi:hypothetical protein